MEVRLGLADIFIANDSLLPASFIYIYIYFFSIFFFFFFLFFFLFFLYFFLFIFLLFIYFLLSFIFSHYYFFLFRVTSWKEVLFHTYTRFKTRQSKYNWPVIALILYMFSEFLIIKC